MDLSLLWRMLRDPNVRDLAVGMLFFVIRRLAADPDGERKVGELLDKYLPADPGGARNVARTARRVPAGRRVRA
jgi:hypothetical protein